MTPYANILRRFRSDDMASTLQNNEPITDKPGAYYPGLTARRPVRHITMLIAPTERGCDDNAFYQSLVGA